MSSGRLIAGHGRGHGLIWAAINDPADIIDDSQVRDLVMSGVATTIPLLRYLRDVCRGGGGAASR